MTKCVYPGYVIIWDACTKKYLNNSKNPLLDSLMTKKLLIKTTQHGPAIKTFITGIDVDSVLSYRSENWPRQQMNGLRESEKIWMAITRYGI